MPWMHRRNEIRDAVDSILRGWVDVKNVYSERFDPAFIDELPILAFYFESDTPDAASGTTQPRIKKRTISMNIDIARSVNRVEGLNSWLDERAFEVEQSLDNNQYLGLDYVENVILGSTTPGDIPVSAEDHMRVLRLNYSIVYYSEIVQTSSLDEFLKFKSDYDIDQDQTRMEAEDFVTIREA